jgi:hypothetical protein
MRPNIEGKPDIVIPSVEAYYDRSYPREKLCVIGVKHTCKDRWRQVVHEAPLKLEKHILTLQAGISQKQLELMKSANISLVVPKKLHSQYPKSAITLLGVSAFIDTVRMKLD